MAILGEGGVVGHHIFQAQATEPAIGQAQMDLIAQSPLGADAVTVPDDQHADHQFWIGRGTAGMAVIVRQMLAQFTKVEAAVNAT